MRPSEVISAVKSALRPKPAGMTRLERAESDVAESAATVERAGEKLESLSEFPPEDTAARARFDEARAEFALARSEQERLAHVLAKVRREEAAAATERSLGRTRAQWTATQEKAGVLLEKVRRFQIQAGELVSLGKEISDDAIALGTMAPVTDTLIHDSPLSRKKVFGAMRIHLARLGWTWAFTSLPPSLIPERKDFVGEIQDAIAWVLKSAPKEKINE